MTHFSDRLNVSHNIILKATKEIKLHMQQNYSKKQKNDACIYIPMQSVMLTNSL